ncbi:hypothetical protein TNCT_205251 [Trichonephila clavata]|uniref:Uncharacterized protein n=1 Tax=Trichonephila clavata TaxID=2740835 RepID=A0A8X6G728_TRICU|nr:hypothetical protein TNCT_205251 [Trichonephila clavata]
MWCSRFPGGKKVKVGKFIQVNDVLDAPPDLKDASANSIFNFYCCDLCGENYSFSSKGFSSHRVSIHRIGVLKERTLDRFGHPFKPLETEDPTASQINPEDLDEQCKLEWALKDSALMYAAK